jgi:tRNA threonylcarbamoyladenosine biosynthesis protein TsaE
MKFFLSTAEQSAEFAKRVGDIIQIGSVFALEGELGTGKTFFTQNLCKSLDVKDYVNSPSYILMNEYKGKFPIFHFDLYRLSSPEEVLELGIYDLFSQGITFIEWPRIAAEFLPENTIWIHFEYPENSTEGRFVELKTPTSLKQSFEKIIQEMKIDKIQ